MVSHKGVPLCQDQGVPRGFFLKRWHEHKLVSFKDTWIIVLENCPDDHTCHVVLCMVAVVMSPQTKRCDKSVLQCSVFGLVQRPPLT